MLKFKRGDVVSYKDDKNTYFVESRNTYSMHPRLCVLGQRDQGTQARWGAMETEFRLVARAFYAPEGTPEDAVPVWLTPDDLQGLQRLWNEHLFALNESGAHVILAVLIAQASVKRDG